MTDENLERVMTVNFENVLRGLLLSAFNSNPKVTPDYLAQPIKRQRQLETEISNLSRKMARTLVSRLKKEGFITREPSDERLQSMIQDTLKDFGMKRS